MVAFFLDYKSGICIMEGMKENNRKPIVCGTENVDACPFCGSESTIWTTMDSEWIMCDKCFACTDIYEPKTGDALKAWNKRIDSIP